MVHGGWQYWIIGYTCQLREFGFGYQLGIAMHVLFLWHMKKGLQNATLQSLYSSWLANLLSSSCNCYSSFSITVKNLCREIQWSVQPAQLKENPCAVHGMFPIASQCAAHWNSMVCSRTSKDIFVILTTECLRPWKTFGKIQWLAHI